MKHFVIAAAVASLCGAAAAEGLDVKFSGFGTLGGVVTNNDEAKYRITATDDKGADKSVDYGVNSVLGLQANVKINETFSAVGQLVASRRIGGSGVPDVEWLYGQAELPSNFKVKLGRMVLPAFLVSDSRRVGYAQHWTNVPPEVYEILPIFSFDGVQLQHTASLGSVNLTSQLSIGKARSKIHFGGLTTYFKVPRLFSFNIAAETGNWLMRIGQVRSFDAEAPGLTPPTTDVFSSVGLQYDNGTLLVMSEYSGRRMGNHLGDSNSTYVSAGWRFGPVMPYFVTSHLQPTGALFGGAKNETSDALGVRWDVAKNIDLKFQVASVKSSLFAFVNPSLNFLITRPAVRVTSLSLDFVF